MQIVTIAELAEIYDGPHATPTRRDEGPYFLNIASLKDGRLDLAESDHVSETDYERWTRRVTPGHGDMLFSYETRLGSAALMPEGVRACLGRRMALLRPRPGRVDGRYLLYRYLAPDFQEMIQQKAIHGATVDRIALTSMGSWSIRVHGEPEQRAIAEVLGALDNKIAANGRLASTADSLAVARFRQASTHDGIEGLTYADVAEVGGGGTPSTTNPSYWEGDIPWATPTDVTGLPGPYLLGTARNITSGGLRACASSLYPKDSILMTSRATIGAFAMATVPTAVNQGFIVASATAPDGQWWLFHEMRSRVDDYLSVANGATFLELSRGRFRSLPVLWADQSTLRSFGECVKPLHDAARQALVEGAQLAALRDALLPELMSGRMRVKDAVREAEEVL